MKKLCLIIFVFTLASAVQAETKIHVPQSDAQDNSISQVESTNDELNIDNTTTNKSSVFNAILGLVAGAAVIVGAVYYPEILSFLNAEDQGNSFPQPILLNLGAVEVDTEPAPLPRNNPDPIDLSQFDPMQTGYYSF